LAKTDPLVAKLKRIEALWDELQRDTPEGPQYEALAKQIRALSVEYQALVAAAKECE
jgi:hypothetical protein